MKHYLAILSLLLTYSVFGQQDEHYVTTNCNCYIHIVRNTVEDFTPTHTEVDSAFTLLKNTDSLSYLADTNRFIVFIKGFIYQTGTKALYIYFDFKPTKDGAKRSDGQIGIFFDLFTKEFYGKTIIGG